MSAHVPGWVPAPVHGRMALKRAFRKHRGAGVWRRGVRGYLWNQYWTIPFVEPHRPDSSSKTTIVTFTRSLEANAVLTYNARFVRLAQVECMQIRQDSHDGRCPSHLFFFSRHERQPVLLRLQNLRLRFGLFGTISS